MLGISTTLKVPSNTRISAAEKSSINLPQIRNMNLTHSSKSVKNDSANNGKVRKSTRKGENIGEFNPDKIAAEVRYNQLQAIFDAAEEEGLPGLDIVAFKRAMRKTVGHKMKDDEIECFFLKVDTSCDGYVDWEEYVTYNLLEYQGKTLMLEMMREKPFPPETIVIPNRHRELIVSVAFYPNIQKRAGQCFIDHTYGRYVTLSREGIMTIWNMKMKQLKTYDVISEMGERATQPWLIDLVCMYNVGMIGLSSTDRDISVFDLQGRNFLKRYLLTGLDDCITCMSYWVDLNDMNRAILCWGDTSGSVCVFVFNQCLRGGPFGSFGGKRNAFKRISVPEVIRGFYKVAKGYRFSRIHDDWVLQVKYIPELSSFVSCCQTTANSLFLCDFEKKKNSSVFKVNKGILCFDYCPENNIIVTGGMDYWIRVWNPYVCSKPIFILKGHTKPISHVIINSDRNQIISADKGRNVRVYDMKDQTCIQQVSGRVVKLGKLPLSAIYFNPVLQTLIMATNKLAILEKSDEEIKIAEIRSHNKPVVAARYNKTFKYVVSACQDSVISVWDLNTGEKIIQTINAHLGVERGVEVPVEITTMSFDSLHRRLITGARDGSVKVWNFNNGNCLQTFNTPEGLAITGVVSIQHKIFVTGWFRYVQIYIDGDDEELRKDWKQRHTEDILCMAHLSRNILATASYDGDIVVWSCDTGQVYCTLNASKGVKPIGDAKKTNLDSRPDTSWSSNYETSPTFENIAVEEMMKIKTRKASLLRQNKDMLNRVKENVLLKDNKWSLQINRLNETPVDHPLLPLFRSQASSPIDGRLSNLSRASSRREDYDELCKLYESAVECILFLEARDRECGETAIMLTSGAEGWVRAWSIYHQGGLLGQFNAAHKVGESVHTMTTDENNQFLFTADSRGYIKIWDITEYCTRSGMSEKERASRWEYLNETFTYMRFNYHSDNPPSSLTSTQKRPANISSRPPPAVSLPKKTLKWPFLVNSFRAHTKMINSIEYVDSDKLLITASSDCSVRVWTVCGLYIGTFGEKWMSIPQQLTRIPSAKVRIPTDLHRSGSSSTLKVLNQGRSFLWKRAIDAAKNFIRNQREEDKEPEQGSQLLYNETPILDSVEQESQRLATRPNVKKTCGSDILGKFHKKTMHHRMPPTIDKFIEINSSVAIYRSLPFSDLNLDDEQAQMKAIDDIRNKYYGGSLLAKLRGEMRPKEKAPALIGIYNKITNRPPLPKGKSQTGRIKRVLTKIQET